MDPKKNWLCMVMKLFKNSPLGTSVGFGFFQLILEKLMEDEFSCPCDSSYNYNYGLVVLIVPTVMVFLLIFTISILPLFKPCNCRSCNPQCNCKSFFEALIILIVPTATWIILVLIDGRYYVCMMTDWPGKYEMIENAAPQKWCKPSNSSQERNSLTKTQLWYYRSEYAGFFTALGLTLFYVVCVIISWCSSPTENERTSENGDNEMALEPLRNN